MKNQIKNKQNPHKKDKGRTLTCISRLRKYLTVQIKTYKKIPYFEKEIEN